MRLGPDVDLDRDSGRLLADTVQLLRDVHPSTIRALTGGNADLITPVRVELPIARGDSWFVAVERTEEAYTVSRLYVEPDGTRSVVGERTGVADVELRQTVIAAARNREFGDRPDGYVPKYANQVIDLDQPSLQDTISPRQMSMILDAGTRNLRSLGGDVDAVSPWRLEAGVGRTGRRVAIQWSDLGQDYSVHRIDPKRGTVGVRHAVDPADLPATVRAAATARTFGDRSSLLKRDLGRNMGLGPDPSLGPAGRKGLDL